MFHRYKRPDYDAIHGYVERIEDALLSESSWTTSDSECSGCLHLSKERISEDTFPRNKYSDNDNKEDLQAYPEVLPLLSKTKHEFTSLTDTKDYNRNISQTETPATFSKKKSIFTALSSKRKQSRKRNKTKSTSGRKFSNQSKMTGNLYIMYQNFEL